MGNIELPHGYGVEPVGIKHPAWKLCWGGASRLQKKNMSSRDYDNFYALNDIICNSHNIGIFAGDEIVS